MPHSFFDFIWQHRDADPRKLALSASKNTNFSMSEVAGQVAALQKIKEKVPLWHRPGLVFPPGLPIEQCSSERTAIFKSNLFSGQKMVDLTSGLGVDVFFFSKNFGQVAVVEQNENLLKYVRHNFEILGVKNASFSGGLAEDFLQKNEEKFDLIYLDPARRDGAGGRVFRLEDCTPNVLKIKDLLFEKSSKILVKTAPMLDLHLAAGQLKNVSKIWVIGTPGECREVLYLLEPTANFEVENIPISAVVLENDGSFSSFDFTFLEEKNAAVEFSMPQKFLVEPPPSVMKSGGFKVFANRFGLSKLHPNTHLFTSENVPKNVPGRKFLIEKICKFDRREISQFLPEGKANVAVRNFPETAEMMKKKLNLRDGGDVFLFGVTDFEGKKAVLICRKIKNDF